MKRIYTLAELEALPTLATGQADDLKIETETRRVWLSRCTVEDGEPYNNKATIEEYQEDHRPESLSRRNHGGAWVVVEEYQAN